MKELKLFIGLIAIGLLSLNFSLNAQTILVDSVFSTNGEIFPFVPGQIIHGLKVRGSFELNSDTSLVRLILYDANYNHGYYSRNSDEVFHNHSTLKDHFDWRNSHGANNPEK